MPPITIIIIGAGQRGVVYANYALSNPTECKIIAVAEPRPYRRTSLAKQHDIPSTHVFSDWKDLAKRRIEADGVVIATLDAMHAECVDVFAAQGYAILCEKPIATTLPSVLSISRSLSAHSTLFSTGHVLRYSPYNTLLSHHISTGILGKIINIQHLEPVGWQHFAHSYVRGNWGVEEETTFSLMAKSCHDIDIINSYLPSSSTPRAISSFGSLSHFKPSEKPAQAGKATHCVECEYERGCPYSAKKIYLDPLLLPTSERPAPDDLWSRHIVDGIPDIENVTDAISPGHKDSNGKETKWGKCVYDGGNDVCDQQVVNIQYEDSTTVSFTMIAFSSLTCERQTRIYGTHGELIGDSTSFTITDFRDGSKKTYAPEREGAGGGHGGGDEGLMRAFVRAVKQKDQSVLGTTPDEIVKSHLMVFAAERARLEDRVVYWKDFVEDVTSDHGGV